MKKELRQSELLSNDDTMRRFFFLLLLLVLISVTLWAQPGGGPPPDPAAPVPIPGIPLLLLMGLLVGIKNIAKKKFKDKF